MAMDDMHMTSAVARRPRRRCLPLLLVAAAMAMAWWWCAGMNTCVAVAAAAPTTPPIRAVNLGGWLVVEGWIKPSPFRDIPHDALLDGTQIFIKSSSKNAYWSARGGGGGAVVVGNQREASSWETFRIWRRPGATDSNKFRLRVLVGGQFVGIAKDGRTVVAAETDPRNAHDFEIIPNGSKVRIKAPNGKFLQATGMADALTADYGSESTSWDDSDPSVFLMKIDKRMEGEFQLCNYYGMDSAATVLKEHWETFINEEDFSYISSQGLNAVRIPVAWWITVQEGSPEATSCRSPFYPGYQEMLDKAFDWADEYSLGVILDLHAAPGSQNGHDHSGSWDGSLLWPTDANIQRTVAAISSLAYRYRSRDSLLAIELLNEPSDSIPLQTLGTYYSAGYRAVREHTADAYVIMSARLSRDPPEILGVIAANGGFRKHVVDVHYYNLYSDTFNHMTLDDNIRYVRDKRPVELGGMQRTGGPPVLVGEWAAEWANKPRGGASGDDYGRFAQAQLDVLGAASFGWAYWTYRNDDAGGDPGWSLKEMMQQGIVSFTRRRSAHGTHV